MQQEDKEIKKPEIPEKKNYTKKVLKGLLYVVAGFIALVAILYGLLSIPAIQQKTLDFALDKVKEITKTDIKIDEAHLKLFNRVNLKGVYIEDLSKDTLLYAKDLDVSLSPLKLLKNQLLIDAIFVDDFTINISQENPDSDFNFQFLIDSFAGDTTQTDTTSSSLKIDIEDITLRNGKLRYDVLSEAQTPNEFNASHIAIYDLNAQLALPSIDLTDFDATLVSLAFKEQSGLQVKNLKGKVNSQNTQFYLKETELTLNNSVLTIPSAEYNLLTQAFKITSDKSTISPSDVLPFMKDLKHLKQDITLRTTLSGRLPSVSIDSLQMNYGNDAIIKASASISDYSRYGKANMELNIGKLQITPAAISDFAMIGDSTFVVPDMLNNLGTIRLDGILHGQMSNLNIKAEAWAKHGAIQMLAKGSIDTTFENFAAQAKLQTQNFNLGALLEMPELGSLSSDLELTASQNTKQPLEADIKGQIQHLEYNKDNYDNIPFTAYYNSQQMGGWLDADLPQGKVEAKVDMTQDNDPKIDVDMTVQDLRIDRFYQNPEWKNPKLSMQMKGNLRGIDLKNIEADMAINNFKFSHDSLSFAPGNFTLKAGISDSTRNYIRLNSSLLKANIDGDYDFMSLSDELANTMSKYLPGVFKENTKKKRIQSKNNFDFDFVVNNTEKVGQVFNLPVDIITPLNIKGNINTISNKLNISAQAPHLRSGEIDIKGTELNLSNTDSIINIIGDSHLYMESDNVYFTLNSQVASDTINTTLDIKRDSTDLNVDATFKALAHFGLASNGDLISNVQFSPSSIDIGKLNLSFLPAHIINEGKRTSISNFGFMVGRGRMLNKYFGIDGVISDQKQDTLNISFFNSNLGNLLKAFDVENMSAIANGNIRVASVLDHPELYTDNMRLSDIILFNDTLGTLHVNSQWSESIGAIKFDAALAKDDINSTINGWVYPQHDSLNLKINLDRLAMSWLQPFMSDMLNKVSGSISTNLTATGKINAPSVQGWMGVNDAYIGIDYTNVTYQISDTIEITPEKIGFDNLIVKDPDGNRARVSATVTHKGFKNMHYNLDATLGSFMVLNTASRIDSLFYGKVYATGTANIKGSDDLINIDMRLRNAKNSKLNVQIPQTADANVYQSVVYINTPVDTTKKVIETIAEESSLPLKLKVNLTVSPDIVLGVMINPDTGDAMQAKGSGIIDFTYDMESEEMNAIGNYVLSDGFVKMKLQNIYNIEFKIKEGSRLVFNGDPLRTNFNITAYKRVRADLTTLDESFGNDQNNSPKVYVDCVLGISGNMNKMDLTYDISLPDANDDIQQRVKTIVSTNDKKVKQFASLVVTGTFFAENGSPGGNVGDGILTNVASSALSSGLNSVLGNMIGGEWQIGTNISSNDGTFTDMDMSVSLSRKFLDNKLEFNTNLGYRTDQSDGANNSFIGDFDVAYALTRSIKLKVFNKTNDRFYKQAYMTQGIGIVYTKEAKTIKELFRFVRKKRNRTRTEQTTGTK